MNDGPKPPLHKAPPPPPARAGRVPARGHVPLPSAAQVPQKVASPPPFPRKDVLPPVPITPPKPAAPKPAEKPSEAKPAPAQTSAKPAENTGNILIAPSKDAKPKEGKNDRTSLLWNTGANASAAPICARESIGMDEPFAEPPFAAPKPPETGQEPPKPAQVQSGERPSYIPVHFPEDFDSPEAEESPKPPATASLAQPVPTQTTFPHFGAINPNAKLALETLFKIFPDKKGPVELKERKLFINGKECGEISHIKNSGETLVIRLDQLGISNLQISSDAKLLAKLGLFFNTITDSFLIGACGKNECAAFSVNSAGVRLSFFKAGSEMGGTSFPLKMVAGEEKK